MLILPIHQGTPEWHAARAKYYRTASRAPIVMGASLYGTTRNDLMAEIKNGVVKEIDANTQALFDAGHAAEDAARKIVEGYLKAPLLPLTCLTDDEYLLASFDGINEVLSVGFEHKLANEKLFTQIRAKALDPFYFWQLEHEALVGNLEYIIFMCSDGTKERAAFLKYVPVPGRAEALLAAWQQFDRDLADYQHIEVIPAATAAPVMALPALSIQVNGAITLTDNLAVFGEKLTAFIERLPAKPSTDQEFADAEQAIKTLETAQNALEAAESSALAQVASVDEMRRTVALYAGQARSTRLMLTKLVASRKEQIRVEIVQAGKDKLAEHVVMLNKRLGKPYMPLIAENMGGVIKGKKTVNSLRDAVDSEVARVKIELNATADRIQINLTSLIDLAGEHKFLFADTAQLVLKDNDDLVNLIKLRISEHQAAEAKRLEAEREKMRAEEQAKAEAEARAKVEAEQRAQRDARETEDRRIEAERCARLARERAEQAIEDKRIAQTLADEEDRLQAERSERAKRQQVEFDREAEKARAAEAERQKSMDIDQILTGLRGRITGVKEYTGIAKAIDAYFTKAQRRAA